MKYHWSCMMDIGRRGNQEDAILIGREVFQENELIKNGETESENFMACVADGMGGLDAGEVVSRFVLDEMSHLFCGSKITEAEIQKGVKEIHEKCLGANLSEDGGATLAGVFFSKNAAFCFNAGDCRVYRKESDGLHRITQDHSFVERLVKKGFIKREEAFGHPYNNVVDFGLGSCFDKEWEKMRPEVHYYEMLPPVCFLVCSDGLSDVLRDEEIWSVIKTSPVEQAKELMNAVFEKGMKDNTSFIIIEVMP